MTPSWRARSVSFGAVLHNGLTVPPCFSHTVVGLSLQLPFYTYQRLFAADAYSFLLDSAKNDTRQGRFSFVGGAPYLIYEARRHLGGHGAADVTLTCPADSPSVSGPRVQRYRSADVFADLSDLLESVRIQPSTDVIPFTGGAVGYFGYEASAFIEDVPTKNNGCELAAPDIMLMFVDSVLAKCHASSRTYLSIFARGSTGEEARRNGAAIYDRWLERIAHLEAHPPAPWVGPSIGVRGEAVPVWSRTDRKSYGDLVRKAKEHIVAGDAFEVCLTHRLTSPFLHGSAWDLYQELRRINPAPFASFLATPDVQVVSSSPERFLKVDREGMAESRPIKGTRRRTGDPEEDRLQRADLLNAIKDRAENIMIADLVRNDFGRVCELDSVEVPELLVVEDYATVFQLVSAIVGQLRSDCTAVDLLKSAFPGGSMTGAPKIEALKIIDRLEFVPRGIYSGTIGYLDHSGAADFSIVIRTFVVKGGLCHFHVGGAIVADSDPDEEYTETIDKARALVNALQNTQILSTPPHWNSTANILDDFKSNAEEGSWA
ncbi:MAG: aminodeoxychorismate synthase component I [Mycobacterium sp.]|nr:aminodeoxychorismate synthase component I [Mycobacterium sp.]